jgi:hypothetical protein
MRNFSLKRYNIVFGVAGSQDKWTVSYIAESFAEAEEDALNTLAANDDRKSYIISIERMS